MFYQGQEQHFSGDGTPKNREALWTSGYNTDSPLYKLTTTLNKIRIQAIRIDKDYLDFQSYPIYTDGSTIAVRKGIQGRQMLTVYSTQGEQGGGYTLNLAVSYPPGQVITEVISCTNITVDHIGTLQVPMGQGLPKVFWPADQMGGSGLCGVGNWTVRGSPQMGNGAPATGNLRSMMRSGWSLGFALSALAIFFTVTL
jgi:alpha-amylase